ncbi:MAG: FapA family protein [Silvanigrellaceae bacterium]|nr:FapA family protein [Silvanigrellaceae bacterium]
MGSDGSNTPQTPTASSNNGSLFTIKPSVDGMIAVIPAKTPISKKVTQFTFQEFTQYIKSQGYESVPTEESFEKVKKIAGSPAACFTSDFQILVGTPSVNGSPPILRWLNPPELPKDLVRPKIPFGKLFPAVAPKPAINVMGKPIPLSPAQGKEKIIEIKLHPEIKIIENNQLICEKGGQISHTKDELIFSDVYKITDIRGKVYQKIEFPCPVHINGDFDGNVNWKVNGNLSVSGHWGVSNIEVIGDVIVAGGFQTNASPTDKSIVIIHGNLNAHFIQVSRIKVGGSLKVENSLLSSSVEVEQEIECTGNPGVILGCELIVKGSILANRLGSEKGTPTSVKFVSEEASKNSKIGLVSAGTRIQIGKTRSIKKLDSAWPEP